MTPSLGALRRSRKYHHRGKCAERALRLVSGRAGDGGDYDRTRNDLVTRTPRRYELWSVRPAHGLVDATAGLDAIQPYVALFFAFEKEDRRHGELDNSVPGASIVLNKTARRGRDKCPNVSVLEPRKDDHGRLVESRPVVHLVALTATRSKTS